MSNLTKYTNAGGCAAKLDPGTLSSLLKELKLTNQNVLVGFDGADDAGIYKINDEQALVVTTDFFTPIVDNPYDFGRIAASNALSDVYAMGGDVATVLNIASIPKSLDNDVVKEIFRGGMDIVSEAGGVIIGGHTIREEVLIYGLSVNGIVHVNEYYSNNLAKVNEHIILTKPLGTGIYSTAFKTKMLDEFSYDEWINSMTTLNKDASKIGIKHGISTMTDVTGFGLLGHCYEVAKESNIEITINYDEVPFLNQAENLAYNDCISGGSTRNKKYVKDITLYSSNIDMKKQEIINDPQTSGGLLMFASKDSSDMLIKELNEKGVNAKVVGETNSRTSDYFIKVL